MITSDRQLKAAEKKIEELKASLKGDFSELPEPVRAGVFLQRQELINELEAEVAEYVRLKSNQVSEIPILSFEDVFLAPIRYRIANHLTVEQFAQMVGIHSRQIARYEEEGYKKITQESLVKILRKLDLKISGSLRLHSASR